MKSGPRTLIRCCSSQRLCSGCNLQTRPRMTKGCKGDFTSRSAKSKSHSTGAGIKLDYAFKHMRPKVSVTSDSSFYVSALEYALPRARLEFFHSDQGDHFTSLALTEKLLVHGNHISMDRGGREHSTTSLWSNCV